jgi:hypothetical protein
MDCRAEYCTALRALPSGSTVMSPGLLKLAKERANACPTCREHAADDLMRFGLIFSSEISEAVAKVSLDIWSPMQPDIDFLVKIDLEVCF